MLRASCDRCHRDKVKCQFEPGISSCMRCQSRRGRCVRSAPLPPGRLKKSARSRAATAPSHSDSQFNQRSPQEDDSVFTSEIVSLSDPLTTQIHHVTTVAPQTLVLGTHDLDCGGGGWWESPTLLEPAMPPWHLGRDYSQDLTLFTDRCGGGSAFPSAGSETSSSFPAATADDEEPEDSGTMDTGTPTRCQCSATLSRFLENEAHPCLSSDPSAFDVVLNTNRAIMSAVRELADCWGPHPPSAIMVACLLVQSVLASVREAWLSDACRAPRKQQQQRTPPQTADGSGPHQQVFIGSYGMDEEDSSVLRRQMVLLDLEKVKRTLHLLQERIGKENDAEGIYSFVNKFLSAEVKRISRRIFEQENAT